MTQEKTQKKHEWDVAATARIQQIVADAYKLTVFDMLARSRYAELVLPRQIAMALAREKTTMSFPDLAKAFSPAATDHGTVMWGCEQVARKRAQKKSFDLACKALADKCDAAIVPFKG